MRRFLIAAALLAGTPAFAAETAGALFTLGRYAEAIKAGTAEATPAGLVAAGRARLQIASYSVTDKAQAKAMIRQSIGDFDAALAKNPNDLEAQLQKIIAQGYIAKLDRSPGGAKAMRRAIDEVLAKHPDNAVAWAALGGWNGGSIATLGSFIASTVMGASTSAMDKAFNKALTLDPRDPAHPAFYAITLLDISTDNAARAKALLQRAVALKPDDAFEVNLQASGAKVLAMLDKGDVKEAQVLARRLQPFGTVR